MRRSRNGLVTACLCLVALTSIQCDQVGNPGENDTSRLVIHLADADERALGPMGLEWFYVYLGLVFDPDFSGEQSDLSGDYKPRLMERWEHTPDYTSWTLHLRDDVIWDDGVPVTAEDVKFSLELWTDPEIASTNTSFMTKSRCWIATHCRSHSPSQFRAQFSCTVGYPCSRNTCWTR